MKLVLTMLSSLILVLPAAASGYWGGVIGVYSDPAAIDCMVSDTPGLRTVYAIQKFNLGSTSSRFRIELSPGFTGTLAAVSSPYSISGDPLTGMTVDYNGACLLGSYGIVDLQFLFFGTSPECSWIRAAPHPLSVDGKLDTYDCAFARHPADWAGTHVQYNLWGWCPDYSEGEGHGPRCLPYTPPLAVEPSTWGAVKALYR